MLTKKINKGFTLLELIVVIAIIALLAVIVIGWLGHAKTKANESKVVEQLASMRNQSELFATNHHNYGTITTIHDCDTTDGTLFTNADPSSLYLILHGMPAGYTPICYAQSTGVDLVANEWAVIVHDGGTGKWCVDNTEQVTTVPTGGPASLCATLLTL